MESDETNNADWTGIEVEESAVYLPRTQRSSRGLMKRASALALRRRAAQRVAGYCAQQPWITGVLVFGSVASGTADAESDIDLLVVCDPHILPVAKRAPLLDVLGMGWQSGPTGNPLFAVVDEGRVREKIPITLHYQTVVWIEAVLHEVLEQGAVSTDRLPFRPYTLPALLQRGWLLVDKDAHIARWRARSARYPRRLQENIVQHFIPILQEQTADLMVAARRGSGSHLFLFYLNRAIDALITILYAINEVYDPADKRAEQTVWPLLKKVPADLVARLTGIMTGPFDSAGLAQQAQHFQVLVHEVIELAHPSCSSFPKFNGPQNS